MKNISLTQEGTILIVRIDLSKEFGLSKAGKSVIIASTMGNTTLENGIKLGINVYRESTADPIRAEKDQPEKVAAVMEGIKAQILSKETYIQDFNSLAKGMQDQSLKAAILAKVAVAEKEILELKEVLRKHAAA